MTRPHVSTGAAPAGTVSYTYDEVTGQMLTVSQEVGGGQPDVVEVLNVYDPQGRVEQQTAASGAVTTFDYGDSYESLVTRVTHEGGAGDPQTLTYSHDENGRLLGIADPDDFLSSWEWEPSGQLNASEGRTGAESSVSYDTALRPEVITGPAPDTGAATVDEATIVYCDATADDQRPRTSTDAAGTVTEFAYGASTDTGYPCAADEPVPSSITVAAGTSDEATTTFASSDGLVTEVTDADGVVTTNNWDTVNERLLSTVQDDDVAESGVLSTYYGYDAFGRLRVTRTPEGVESWTTYTDDGWVASQVGPVSVPSGERTCSATACTWPSTPPAGPTVTFAYWGDGRQASRTDEEAEVWSDQRDYLGAGGWTDTATEPDGDVRVEVYDSAGNLVEERVGDPADQPGDELAVTTHHYGTLGRRDWTESPEGVRTTFRYDEEGRLVETTVGADDDDDPAHTTTTTYDQRGRVIQEQGPTGDVDADDDPVRSITTYGYDALGRVTSTVEGNGAGAVRTSTVYDRLGRVRFEITDSDGDGEPNNPVATNPADRDPGDLVIEHTYTPAGRPESIIRPPADVTSFDWVDGDQEDKRVATFDYDDAGRTTSITRPDDEVVTLTLDGDGRTARRDDPTGYFEAYTYNARGQVTQVETPSPTGTGTVVATASYDDRGALLTETEPHPSAATSYPATLRTYYPDGALWTVRDPRQVTIGAEAETAYSYDGRGNRRTRTVWAANDGSDPEDTHQTTEEWRYNLDDQLLEHERPLGGTTTNTYDSYGRLVEIEQPSGRVETRTWWNSGPMHTQTFTHTGLDTIVVEQFYDDLGRRTTMVDGTGTSEYSYDPAGHLAGLSLPSIAQSTQSTYTYTYDLTGNQIHLAAGGVGVYDYTHTVMDQQETVQAHLDGSSIIWPIADQDYDAAGHLTHMTVASGPGGRDWDYLDNGAPYVETFDQSTGAGADRTTEMTWNAQGRIATESTSTPTSGAWEWEYEYDEAGQLVSAWDVDTRLYEYSYGPRGERLTSTVDSVATTYAFDDDARLVSSEQGSTSRTYAYDPDGRRTLTTSMPGSTQVRALAYDARGLLASVQNGGTTAPVETRTYDGDGRFVSYASGGTVIDMTWDPTQDVDQVFDVRVGTNGRVILSQAAQRVAFGLVIDGEILGGGMYTYDAHGSSIFNDTFPAPTDYLPFGEAVDLLASNPIQPAYRAEMYSGGLLHLRNRDYDPETGTFTTPDPLDGVDGTPTVANPYQYADNDPLNRVDPLGLSTRDADLDPNCGSMEEGECYLTGAYVACGAHKKALQSGSQNSIITAGLCLAAVGVLLGVTITTINVGTPPGPEEPDEPDDDGNDGNDGDDGDQVVSYRGVDGNPGCRSGLSLGPSAFRLDPDGVSTFERPYQGVLKPCLVSFVFVVPDRATGATGPVAELPACTATHTPSFGIGHWSINCAGDTRQILSTYAKSLRDAGRIEENELYGI